ncbi:MAG: histidine ammonia-lyase [Phycisphaerales bacterium]|nr:histidine ammonia-lyase [Phycisphaerales bacterium]
MPASTPPSSVPTPVVLLDGGPLSIEQVEAVARFGTRVEVSPTARGRVAAARRALESAIATHEPLYGVNTGFGSLSRTRIADADLRDVQRNLVRSHAAGVGRALPVDVVRAMMLLLAGSLCRGHSGVREPVVDGLVGMLNAGITPVVPESGSVGASGDLAPLSHAALVLIGGGEATLADGGRVAGGGALRGAGLRPVELGAKEGLALINGTHLMAAQGALLAADVERVFGAALAAAAMSIDACRGTDAFLDPRVYVARAQPGPAQVAARLAGLMRGSQIVPSHLHNDPRVQDPYSLRCAPIVLGAAWDAMGYVRGAVERELGAVTDNPLVFPEGGADAHDVVVSAGCFHGMPMAIPLDALAIALSHVAGISERRVYYILSASDEQNPLNAYLSPQPGLHSGLMIVQYTAAALCNEMIGLATPASVSNIPTSAGMEDYNSFGPRAAAKARRSLDLCTSVVAIELLTAAEAMEYQRPLKSGAGVEAAHEAVRSVAPRLVADRSPSPDIEAIEGLIRAGRFVGGW